ncbi:MAG: glycosyltransferase family 4 protein [Atribacterota bacterium]|nr:glycosyltransferase family 4 protein [Atribacterota bacterium]
MKIIQTVSYYPPHIGGVENVAREIAERMAKKGYQVEIFTSDIGCRRGKLESEKNLKIHYLPSWEFAHTPIMPSLFFKLLKIPRDSVIHVHLSHALVPEIVYLISKIKKVPYIAHLHSDPQPSGPLGHILLTWYKKLFTRKILANARKIICLTKEQRQLIHEKYGINKNKIIVIPNGVNEKYFTVKKNNSRKPTYLLSVGRLSGQKNIPIMLKVASILKGKAVLHIVGDGEKRRDIERIINDKKLNNVVLYGNRNIDELIDFYANAEIFISTSTEEGFPLVFLEALASGTPIVAADIKEIRGFFREISILVNPPTPENFAREIEELIKNKEKKELLVAKGMEIVKNLSWEKITEQYENVYKNTVKVL